MDGDYFGEISLIKNVPRTASVISRTPCTLLTLTRDHLHALLDDSPELKQKLNNDLIKRLLETDRFHISLRDAVPALPA